MTYKYTPADINRAIRCRPLAGLYASRTASAAQRTTGQQPVGALDRRNLRHRRHGYDCSADDGMGLI